MPYSVTPIPFAQHPDQGERHRAEMVTYETFGVKDRVEIFSRIEGTGYFLRHRDKGYDLVSDGCLPHFEIARSRAKKFLKEVKEFALAASLSLLIFSSLLKCENPEFAAFARRILRAAGRRIAKGDPTALGEFASLQDELRAALDAGVKGMRERGFSWAEIANGVGVTTQTAWERWRNV